MIRIATRRSTMALAQTEEVKQKLIACYPDLLVGLAELDPRGDKDQISKLDRHGGKGGAFVAEIRSGILSGQSECAMHSLKDVPGNEEVPGLNFAAFLTRDDPTDSLVLRPGLTMTELSKNGGAGYRIGTNSVRRAALIRQVYDNAEIIHFRGAADTRIRKLDEGVPQKLPDGTETPPADALLLATAGLTRIGFADRISHRFSTDEMIPAVGQGIVAVECATDNWKVREILSSIDDPISRAMATAEREVLWFLDGHCNSPIAAHATMDDQQMIIQCAVMSLDGSEIIQHTETGLADYPRELGRAAGLALLQKGAKRLIDESEITSTL